MDNIVSMNMSVEEFLNLYARYNMLGEALEIDYLSYAVRDNDVYLLSDINSNNVKKYMIPDFITNLDSMLFMDTSIKTVICGRGLRKIGVYCFTDSTINKIEFNHEVVLGDSCFENCLYLREVINSNLITYVGKQCFYKATKLKNLDLSGALKIDSFAFLNSTIETLTIRSDVEVNENSFYNMLYLNTVYIKGNKNEYLESLLKKEKFNVNIEYIS